MPYVPSHVYANFDIVSLLHGHMDGWHSLGLETVVKSGHPVWLLTNCHNLLQGI